MTTKFRDKVVPIWIIVYDNDINKVYCYTDSDKALASVEGSIRTYVGDSSSITEFVCDKFMEELKKKWGGMVIPVQFNNLHVTIYCINLDRHSQLHGVLSDCYNNLDDFHIKNKVDSLFISTDLVTN